MQRRAKFALAAEDWMKKRSSKTVTTDELWEGLKKEHPDLTAVTEARKTPRTTCMRDLRKDAAFEVGGRKVTLK